MSEPVKHPGQQPESYQPKKPEIVGMVEQAQNSPIAASALAETIPVPEILTKRFMLAGFEAAIDLKEEHWPGMDYVKAALKENLYKLGNLAQPLRFISAWEADPNANYKRAKNHSKRLFFFGVEVTSLEGIPEGFIAKDFPETTYALFKECDHGSPKFKWLEEAGYKFDTKYAEKYAMDIEIYDDIEDEGPEWDALIPIEAPEGYQPKKPEIVGMVEEINQNRSVIMQKANIKAAPATIKAKARDVVRIIELPASKMIWSGICPSSETKDDDTIKRFSEWFPAQDELLRRDHFYARDWLWHDREANGFAWGLAITEIPIAADGGLDTGCWEVIDFPGGLFAVANYNCVGSPEEGDRKAVAIYESIKKWVERSGCFAMDEGAGRHIMWNGFCCSEAAPAAMGYRQFDQYVPIRIKEA